MKPCDMDTGSARIRYGTEELLRVWGEVTAEDWSDASSEAFEKEFLETIEPMAKKSLDAINRMRTLLHEAQRDLADDAPSR